MSEKHVEYQIWSPAKQFLKKENGKQSVKCTGTGDEDSSIGQRFSILLYLTFFWQHIFFFIVSKASS